MLTNSLANLKQDIEAAFDKSKRDKDYYLESDLQEEILIIKIMKNNFTKAKFSIYYKYKNIADLILICKKYKLDTLINERSLGEEVIHEIDFTESSAYDVLLKRSKIIKSIIEYNK